MTAPEVRRDRQVSLVQWLTAGTTVLAVLLLVVAIPYILDSSAGIDAQQRGDEIAACRSEYRAPIDQADALLEGRRTLLDRVSLAQADTVVVGLAALVAEDDATLEALAAGVPERRAAVADALAQVDEAQEAKDKATNAYQRAVTLSRTDQPKFLRECRALR